MPTDDDYLNIEKNPPVGARFHWRDGFYFQRTALGAVILSMPYWDGTAVKVIPPKEWASIVACVSARGENADTHAEALTFHGGPATP